MQLAAYLDRIGFSGTPQPDFETFRAVHRAHALSIPYENLDVQMQRRVTRDPKDAFDKIVARRRGGWCYEMNGLLAWALEEIGFDVRRLAGAVMRDVMGDAMIGNHLVLLVRIGGEDYIGDVGFGDGLIEPAPLRAGPLRSNPFSASLIETGGGWWRYVNDPIGGGPNFDFNPAVSDDAMLETLSLRLQTDPASPFVQNAVVQFWRDGAHYSLRGRVLKKVSPPAVEQSLIASAEDYVAALTEIFGIGLPEAAALWPAIAARHDALFAEAAEAGAR